MKLTFLSCCLLSALCVTSLPSCKPSRSETKTEQSSSRLCPELPARLQKQPLLALVPQESSFVFSLNQINPLYKKAMGTQTGILLKEKMTQEFFDKLLTKTGDTPAAKLKESLQLISKGANVSPVEDVIVSLGDKQPEFLLAISDFMTLAQDIEILSEASKGTIPATLEGKENPAYTLAQSLLEKKKADATQKAKTLFKPLMGAKSAPLMVLATLSDTQVAKDLPQKLEEALAQLKAKSPEFITDYSLEKDGWTLKGVELKSQEALSKLLDLPCGDKDDFATQAIKTQAAAPSLYLLTGVKDNKMVLFLCTEPQKQVLFAQNPESSLLASDKVAFLDKAQNKDIVGLSYISPEWLQMNYKLNSNQISPFISALSFIEELSPALTPKSAEIKTLSASIIESSQSLLKISSESYDLSVPCSALAWMDKGLKIEVLCGKSALLNEPARFTNINPTEFPEATITAYGASSKKAGLQALQHMEQGAKDIYKLSQLLSEQPQLDLGEMKQITEPIKMFEPAIENLWSGMKETYTALGNQSAFVLEIKDVLPALSSRMQEVSFLGLPEISWGTHLENRAALSPAWDKIESALLSSITKMGAPVSKEQILPKKTTQENWTIYSYPMLGIETLCPSLMLDSSTLTLGTSLPLNKKLASALQKPGTPTEVAACVNVATRTFFTQLAGRAEKHPVEKTAEVVPYLKSLAADLKGFSYTVTPTDKTTVIHLSFDTEN